VLKKHMLKTKDSSTKRIEKILKKHPHSIIAYFYAKYVLKIKEYN